MNEHLYQLKIQLIDIEPAIWRRFVVPGSITLDRLHDVIQIVMGWTDNHLYDFLIGVDRYTEDPESESDELESGDYRLENVLNQTGQPFFYRYDFGDDWAHKVVIEDTRFHEPELIAPLTCLSGQRACPPEDVGGAPGYAEFLHVLQDPTHEDHHSYLKWCGGQFDSNQFDPDLVNWELMKYIRWARDRHLNWYKLT